MRISRLSITGLSIIFLSLTMAILSGCMSNNDDPTNIELEVLRATLLEKELSIDELHKSLDENADNYVAQEETIRNLEIELKKMEFNLSRVLELKEQEFRIQDSKPHYYDANNKYAYILTYYEDSSLQRYDENLYQLAFGERKKLIYQGKDIQFYVQSDDTSIIILDQNGLQILNKNLEKIYTAEISLNDPLVDLTPSLFMWDIISENLVADTVNFLDRQKSVIPENDIVIGLTKSIVEGETKLFALHYYNIADMNNIIHELYYFDTNEYIYNQKNLQLFYVEYKENAYILKRFNVQSGRSDIIHTNSTSGFRLYIKNNKLYYYNEENAIMSTYELK